MIIDWQDFGLKSPLRGGLITASLLMLGLLLGVANVAMPVWSRFTYMAAVRHLTRLFTLAARRGPGRGWGLVVPHATSDDGL